MSQTVIGMWANILGSDWLDPPISELVYHFGRRMHLLLPVFEKKKRILLLGSIFQAVMVKMYFNLVNYR